MPSNTLKLEYSDEVATLTFNRPGKRNALSPEVIEEWMANARRPSAASIIFGQP